MAAVAGTPFRLLFPGPRRERGLSDLFTRLAGT